MAGRLVLDRHPLTGDPTYGGAERYGLPDADYAAHGGCFPIHVAGTGIIGAVTVSGLTQREDHNLVVEALCLALKKDHDSLRLPHPH